MSYLLDTGVLYALLNDREKRHADVLEQMQRVHEPILLPTPVIGEVSYLILRDLGARPLADFVETLSKPAFGLVKPVVGDYSRAAEILRQYDDANIDYVDVMIIAIAERLKITRILTLDQRHFRLFRPAHCDAFELFP